MTSSSFGLSIEGLEDLWKQITDIISEYKDLIIKSSKFKNDILSAIEKINSTENKIINLSINEEDSYIKKTIEIASSDVDKVDKIAEWCVEIGNRMILFNIDNGDGTFSSLSIDQVIFALKNILKSKGCRYCLLKQAYEDISLNLEEFKLYAQEIELLDKMILDIAKINQKLLDVVEQKKKETFLLEKIRSATQSKQLMTDIRIEEFLNENNPLDDNIDPFLKFVTLNYKNMKDKFRKQLEQHYEMINQLREEREIVEQTFRTYYNTYSHQ